MTFYGGLSQSNETKVSHLAVVDVAGTAIPPQGGQICLDVLLPVLKVAALHLCYVVLS